MTASSKKKNVLNKPKPNTKNKNPAKKTEKSTSENKGKSSDKDSIFPSPDIAFKAFLSARFCSAIWGHITDCDETYNYWEPSHFLLYGKGFQTWEYSPPYALRSYTYLLLHVVPAWIYANLFQPNRMLIFYFIRCILGLFCALCETYFYKAVYKEFGNVVARLMAAFLIFSPGMFISSTAFLPSSFSMYMTMLTTGAWINEKYELAIFTTALSTLLSWPFSALLAFPLLMDIFSKKLYKKFIKWSIISGLVILIPMIKMDSELFGRLVIAPLNIVKYNIFSQHGSKLYGTEPFHFYFINGFLNFNIAFVFAVLAPGITMTRNHLLYSVKKNKLVLNSWHFLSSFYLWFFVFTIQPHKEERFLFPVNPLICLSGAVGLSSIHAILTEYRSRKGKLLIQQTSKVNYATYSMILVTALFGLSRVFALYRGYHAPMDLYMELNKIYAEDKIPSNTQVNICVGKEWHRFPNSFFLPGDNWNLKFIKSEFRGQLPAEYSRTNNATSIVHTHFNDMNLEETSRYFDIENCQFLVDFDNGKYTQFEPDYSQQREKWKIYSSLPFLNNEKSHRLYRAFFIPFFSDYYCTYSEYRLYVSTKFQMNDVGD